jgi:hypothetical protein
MGRHVTRMKKKKYIQISFKIPGEKRSLGDLGVCRLITLKRILRGKVRRRCGLDSSGSG